MAKRSLFEGLSENERTALAQRIREMVDKIGTQSDAAEVACISLGQLKAYITGRSAPSLLPIGNLAIASGFDMNWVLTGEGPQQRPDGSWQSAAEGARAEFQLAQQLDRGLQAIYKEAQVPLSDESLLDLAGDILDALEQFTPSLGERLRLAPLLLDVERRRVARIAR